MNQHALLAELFQRGVTVWADGERLRVRAPEGALTPELKESLRLQKQELLALVGSTGNTSRPALPPIVRVQRQGRQPLSRSQERLWSLSQASPDSAVYNLPKALRLHGPLDTDALAGGVRAIVRRHEALRTTFADLHGRPAQWVHAEMDVVLPIDDLRGLPVDERESELQRLAADQGRAAFDLVQGPLWRVRLVRMADSEHVFLLTVHHLVFDGWSFELFCRELTLHHDALVTGQATPLSDLPVQYADFCHWEGKLAETGELPTQLAAWKRQLEGPFEPLELPLARPRPRSPALTGARYPFVVDAKLTAAVRLLAEREDCTLLVVLLAAFQSLLHTMSGQERFIVCAPFAGRHRPETKDVIGYFSRLLPMRADFTGSPSHRQVLDRVRTAVAEAYENQDAALQTLAALPGIARIPLTRSMFLLQKASEGPALAGLRVERMPIGNGAADFELSLSIDEGVQSLDSVLEYRTDLFDEADIHRMARDFQALLEAMAADPAAGVSHAPRGAGSGLARRPARPHRPAGTRLEQQLVEIWETALQVKPIGLDDDFFDLGGHSLMAAELFALIHERFGRRLQLATLLAAPTIALLARQLLAEAPVSFTSLVPLQPHGSARPFFCVHAESGEVLVYRDLALALGEDQPFYGLQARQQDGVVCPHATLEEMASHYIREMRTVQPEGPYLLGGACMGAVIAFEMAQQLRADGQEIRLLVMMDAFSPFPRPTLAIALKYGVPALLRHPVASTRYLFHSKVADRLARMLRPAGRGAVAHAAAKPPEAGTQEPKVPSVRAKLQASYRLYSPRPYPGPIAFFRNSRRARLPFEPWSHFAPAGLERHVVSGNHVQILFRDVGPLSEALRACIEKAQAA